MLFWVYVVLLTFIVSTFSFFLVHSVLWFFRSLFDVLKNGRASSPRPGVPVFERFSSFHRIGHAIMLCSFLGLALTGLPLKYSSYEWAHALANLLGGFESTGTWHRFFGLINIGCLAVYVGFFLRQIARGLRRGKGLTSLIFGPDSPVPNRRDVRDCFEMIRWFVGLGPKPTFERWTYWEKYDFWGACGDIAVIGFTGLVLWFPNAFCAYLPGEVLNIAKVIHSTQAFLATGFVFAIHFFNTHLRPEKFPMDMSVLTGLVSEEEFREERGDYYERLRREGALEPLKANAPSRNRLALTALGGALALATGLGLLVGILMPLFK
ncbi:MAG: hypothetical protein GXP27_02815 [Planctomycetes bacterium]|nr:hypothetical protein [Planctomycetota bacterium]